MLNDELPLEWKSAAENGIEIKLLDDDFSNPIDGSGYTYTMDYSLRPEAAK